MFLTSFEPLALMVAFLRHVCIAILLTTNMTSKIISSKYFSTVVTSY
jgi:hypothetical protein